MKRTTKLIATMIIAVMMCLSLKTFVNAADGQKIYINLIYDFLYKGDGDFGVDYTNNTITMYNGQVGKIVEAGAGYGTDNPLEGYDMSIVDESVLKLETTHFENAYVNRDEVTITALKEGTTTLTLKAPSDEPNSESRTFKVTVLPNPEGDEEQENPPTTGEDQKDEESSIKQDVIENFNETDHQYLSSGIVDVETFNTILEVAKERNLETFEISENTNNGVIVWSFNTADTNEISKDFIASVNLSNEKLSNIESDDIKDAMFIDFDYSGNLPSTATVTISTWGDAKKFGDGEKTLNLYYYNPETKSYEFSQKANYSDGAITFKLDHCSTYALTEKTLDNSSSQASGELDSDPKTGANSIFAIEVIAVLSLAGIIIAKRYSK